MDANGLIVTHQPKVCADRAEIRTVDDLVAYLLGALDVVDIGTVAGTESHRGFTVLLPDGLVRVQLSHGRHVPIRRPGAPVSDQYPVIDRDAPPATISLHAGNGWEADDCGDAPADRDPEVDRLVRSLTLPRDADD
jgi:hypothetical protein